MLASPGEGEWHSKHDTGQLFPPLTCYPTHGKKLAQCGDCEILQRCSVSPSPQLYKCLPKRRCAPTHRRRQHSMWSEPSPQGGTAHSTIQPLLGDSLPFLLTSVADKELLRASEVHAQRSYGTQQRQGWICLLQGQCLQVHHLIVKGRGGNLGHVSRPGYQGSKRVGRSEHSPEAACPLHVAPQPVLDASVVKTTCRDTCSKGTPAHRKAMSVRGERAATHRCDGHTICTVAPCPSRDLGV